MVTIQRKIIPYNFTAMSNKQNLYIVIHYVGAVSTAKNNADYYARQKLNASAHYFVDENSIWQSVDDKDRAWHCGGGLQGSGGHAFYKKCMNSNSIGVEMCCKKTTNGVWYFESDTVVNTVELVKYLMKKYNIPIDRVIRHYDVTGKICPAPFINDSVWQQFKEKITEEDLTVDKYNELKNMIASLQAQVEKLANPMIYAWVDDNMPEWARETITKLMNKGYLKGDTEGKLMLDTDMLRILVILDRAKVFD